MPSPEVPDGRTVLGGEQVTRSMFANKDHVPRIAVILLFHTREADGLPHRQEHPFGELRARKVHPAP